METMEIDVETKALENQISFDFLEENHTETLQQSENFEWVANETLVVILDCGNKVDLCGKSMNAWVELATSGCKQKIIPLVDEEKILETVRPLAENFNFVAVLYGDTPLLHKETFLQIMDFFSKRKMNVLKLERGFVFRGEYLKTARLILSANVEHFGNEDFTRVNDPQSISFAFKTLNARILEYHKQHGVILLGEESIFIDADVEIEEGAVIHPNNSIKGESFIGKDAVILSGNILTDTIVCENATLVQSNLNKCKVEKGKHVGPFANLDGVVI